MQSSLIKACGLALTLAFNTACAADTDAPAPIIGRASVIDGDTIEIHGNKIRLHGIDAPESNQTCTRRDNEDYRCGQQAALFLDGTLISSATTTCHVKDIDRYGRAVSECFARNVNINEEMVRNGWAVAYTQYSKDYIAAEAFAKDNKNGIWAGTFQMPWDFRISPTQSEIIESNGCTIKGNINSEGKRIYHRPGGRYYGQTVIDIEQGERWFCTETEAQQAGWAKSQL